MDNRILIVQDYVPHYRVPFFEGLVDAGFDVTVAHSGSRAAVPFAFKEEIVTSTRFGSFLHQPGVVELSGRFDAVVASLNPKRTASIGVWRNSPGRTVLWGHGPGRSRVLNRLRVAMCNRAAAVAVYDNVGKQQLVELGVEPDLVRVVPNTIHIESSSFDAQIDRDQFLFVGRLQKRKRIDDLLRAFGMSLKSLPPKVKLTIIGSGPEEADLRAQVSGEGLGGRVRFVAETTDDVVLRAEFSRSIAYVSPGWVGLGVLHSFAYGVPVVTDGYAAHAPEFANIHNDMNGILFDGTVAGLAAVLQLLASDPDRSIQLGAEAFSHYSNHRRMDQMVSAMATLLERALVRPSAAA